jgi:hypothetical protein
VTIPRYGTAIAINGHQAKIIPTDFVYGSKTLLYSTAEVLTYSIVDGKEVLALWVPTGESGEFTVKGVSSAKVALNDGCANVKIHNTTDTVTVSYLQNAGMSIIELGDGSRVVLLDRTAAYLFWSPALDNNPTAVGNDTRESIPLHGGKIQLTRRSPRSRPISCPQCDGLRDPVAIDG